MGLWDGIENAQVTKRGVYLGVGDYTLRINKCEVISTRDKGDAYIVEFEVLESSNPQDPVGAVRNWYQATRDKNVFQGAVKGFVAAVYGYSLPDMESRFNAEVGPQLAAVCDASVKSNSLAGQVVKVTTTMIKTQKNQKDFTRHDWKPFQVRA